MKVYAGMPDRLSLSDTAAWAQRAERLGYDGVQVPETVHDSLAVSLLALEHSTNLTVIAGVALAFPRSPMLTAYSAWDLAEMSNGRFVLGLGTQIRQNIVERYSVAWSDPVGRMADYVASLRSIWESFTTGARLDHRGEHYQFTRLQPVFNPGPIPSGPPPIWLAGVNEGMVALAAQVADGYITHPTNSNPRYLDELCLPVLAQRLPAAGPLDIVAYASIVTAPTSEGLHAARERQRYATAFLYTTPAYARSLELHGFADLPERLRALVRSGTWDGLGAIVTDEVLDALTLSATWDDLPEMIERWYSARTTSVIVAMPDELTAEADGRFAEVIRAIQRIPSSTGE
jgi:probable F420-dependent oxidoreductase